jgi:hypothetical protein
MQAITDPGEKTRLVNLLRRWYAHIRPGAEISSVSEPWDLALNIRIAELEDIRSAMPDSPPDMDLPLDDYTPDMDGTIIEEGEIEDEDDPTEEEEEEQEEEL